MADWFLYLASASPRRRELLRQIHVDFEVIAPNVIEIPRVGETAEQYVVRAALDKARAVQDVVLKRSLAPHPVLGADTEVVFEGEILGKPRDRTHGMAMLKRLAGRTHEVLSGIAIVYQGREYTALSKSRVTFAPLSEPEIEDYWETGEPVGKAGGYAIQGRAAAFVRYIDGNYSGIVGLPLYELNTLLGNLR